MTSLIRFFALFLVCMSPVAAGATATFNAVTDGGIAMTIEIDTPVTMAATSALACLDSATALSEAKLWMVMDSGHEHGSTPTTVVAAGNNCYRVNGINFVMTGVWQIRIKLANGDRGTFFIPVGG